MTGDVRMLFYRGRSGKVSQIELCLSRKPKEMGKQIKWTAGEKLSSRGKNRAGVCLAAPGTVREPILGK